MRRGGKYSQYLRVAAYLLTRSKEYDVVIDDINGVPFFSSIFSRVPVIAVIHHIVGWPIFRKELAFPLSVVGYLGERSIPFFYSRCPFVTVSDSSKMELVDFGVKEGAISVIQNAIDFSCDAEYERSPIPRIIYFGRIKDYKRVDHVIKAFSNVRAKVPGAELIIAGRGDFAPLGNLVAQLGLEGSVHFQGEVDDEEKKRLLSSSWVFVTASMKEGWGISVIEANACGTPAVAYDVPGLRDSIRDGQTGALSREEGIEDLSRNLLAIINDEALRERMSRQAREWAAGFSWEKSADEFEHIILRCLKE